MRKVLIACALLLLPASLWAQALQVTSVTGAVQWRAASSKTFVPLTKSVTAIQPGDEIRTADGASLILTVPTDGSYMVVSENSKVVIEDFWSGSFRSIMNLMMGEVRFYIQRLGGRPNPYSVRTPTALIAVRGTIFDVNVDPAQIVEVQCIEGRVTVQNTLLTNREVILEPGLKTLVRPNEYPLPPVSLTGELRRDRVIEMKKVNPAGDGSVGAPSLDILNSGNDRGNRPSDPQFGSHSVENPQRAKPTLTFP